VERVELSLTEDEAKLLKLMCAAKDGMVAEAIRANGYSISNETAQKLTMFSADLFHSLKLVKITNGDL
jgi:hypothetical protein